jgi:sugar lactone lactonase YvrE
MVRAYALMDKPTSAYHYMLKMQQQGLSYDFDQLEETVNLRGTEVYSYLNDLLIRAGEPAGDAEVVFRLGRDFAGPSAIAWDESRKRFLVGTARDGLLLAVSEEGKVDKLLEANEGNGLGSIRDIAVDAPNNRLWLSSSSIQQPSGSAEASPGRSGLFEMELDSLKPVARYELDDDGTQRDFGAVVVAPNGDVFVADRLQAVVYRKPATSDRLAAFVADEGLDGFSDMAISPDGGRLYLSDTSKGVLVVDPENDTAAMLEGPETLNLGRIEAIFHAGRELVIVQAGIDPERLLALQLDASGGKVEEVRPMAIALEVFDGPAPGTIRGESVYYFADAGDSAREVTVLRTGLDAGQSIVAPDMRKFEEETLSKARDHQ